jgi:lytic cellulose monooxygenase (C1-hydroxylating)
MMRLQLFATFWAFVFQVLAHGRITNVTTSTGTSYTGWDPEFAFSGDPLPELVAWSASNLGNIFVRPSKFNTSDITCHYASAPGVLHVDTFPGDELKLQWNEWPTSHKGPVVDYLADCKGDCAHADKHTLEWVKISEWGWLNSSGWQELSGTWASDVLIANKASWMVKVPKLLAEGNYVLRHEIIALHVADQVNGAQAYPQCINLQVTKREEDQDGSRLMGGVVGSDLYTMEDKGILVDIHRGVTGYDIPGPRLWEHATSFKQPNQ